MSVRVSLVWALCVLAPGVATADEDLGRLFHTPAERALLDAAREAVALPLDVPVEAPGPTVPSAPGDDAPAAAAPVTVNGVVQRERGPSTAWINGAAGTRVELEARDGGQVRIGRGVVEIGGERHGAARDVPATRARVKPGQVFDPAQGRVVESFEQSVAPPRPAP